MKRIGLDSNPEVTPRPFRLIYITFIAGSFRTDDKTFFLYDLKAAVLVD